MAKKSVCVKCPYYKREERQMIFCEGVQDNTAIHLAFAAPEALRDYRKKHCLGCWAECRIAKMLNEKWDYDI